MKIDILIDKLTPCLLEIETGKILSVTGTVLSSPGNISCTEKGFLKFCLEIMYKVYTVFDFKHYHLKGCYTV